MNAIASTWLSGNVIDASVAPVSGFTASSFAVSPSYVATAVAALLLCLLSWPLIKLKLLGERQRVRVADMLTMGLCSLLGVATDVVPKINKALEAQTSSAELNKANLPKILKAFDVLCYLVEHAGRLVTQDEILEALWRGGAARRGAARTAPAARPRTSSSRRSNASTARL